MSPCRIWVASESQSAGEAHSTTPSPEPWTAVWVISLTARHRHLQDPGDGLSSKGLPAGSPVLRGIALPRPSAGRAIPHGIPPAPRSRRAALRRHELDVRVRPAFPVWVARLRLRLRPPITQPREPDRGPHATANTPRLASPRPLWRPCCVALLTARAGETQRPLDAPIASLWPCGLATPWQRRLIWIGDRESSCLVWMASLSPSQRRPLRGAHRASVAAQDRRADMCEPRASGAYGTAILFQTGRDGISERVPSSLSAWRASARGSIVLSRYGTGCRLPPFCAFKVVLDEPSPPFWFPQLRFLLPCPGGEPPTAAEAHCRAMERDVDFRLRTP